MSLSAWLRLPVLLPERQLSELLRQCLPRHADLTFRPRIFTGSAINSPQLLVMRAVVREGGKAS